MEKPTTLNCALLAIDLSDYSYKACSRCERVLPDVSSSSSCRFCNFDRTKRFFRVLMSVAVRTEVKTVVCFDRAARVLFGCSADEFFNFAKLNPSAAATVGQVLEGELFRMTLSKPKNGKAQHVRVTSVAPLSSNFKPAMVTLREIHNRKSASVDP